MGQSVRLGPFFSLLLGVVHVGGLNLRTLDLPKSSPILNSIEYSLLVTTLTNGSGSSDSNPLTSTLTIQNLY